MAQTDFIYYDQALQWLAKLGKVNGSAACCAECLKFEKPAGAGGGATPCNLWTFCPGPGGGCTLANRGIASPPQWTNMTVGDCVLLNWPTSAKTGQIKWTVTAQSNATNLSYQTGARPVLLCCSNARTFPSQCCTAESARLCESLPGSLLCVRVARKKRVQLSTSVPACSQAR